MTHRQDLPAVVCQTTLKSHVCRVVLTDRTTTKDGKPVLSVECEFSHHDAMGAPVWIGTFHQLASGSARDVMLRHAADVIGGHFAEAVAKLVGEA